MLNKWAATGFSPDISHANRSADFQVRCVAGFPTCGVLEDFDAVPIRKSATQQVGKPALRMFRSLPGKQV